MSANQYDVESDDDNVVELVIDGDKQMEIETPPSLDVVKVNTEYFIQIIEEPDTLFEAVQLNLWLVNEVTFKNLKICLDHKLRVIIIFYDSHLKAFRGYAKVLQVFKSEEIHVMKHTYADIEWLGFGDVELRNLDNIIEGRLLNGMKIHEEEGNAIIKEIDKNLDIQPQCFQNSFTNPTFYNSTCQTLFRSQSFSEYNTNNTNIKILQRSLSNIDIITDNNMECEGLSLPLLPPYDSINYPPPFTYQYIRYSSFVGRMKNNNNNNNKPMIVEENKHLQIEKELNRSIIQSPVIESPTKSKVMILNDVNKVNKENVVEDNKNDDNVSNVNNKESITSSDVTETNTTDFLDSLLDHEEDFEFD